MTMLSIVIPALNEEDGIQEVMDRVLSIRPGLGKVGVDEMELIVVDDGSTDNTPEIVRQMSREGVRLVRHPTNKGYGGALKTGFAESRGEWVGFLDADGTYPPEHFPALCEAAATQHADIVIGSRMAGEKSEMPAMRRLGNRIFATLVSVVSAERITDSASGMRIFRKALLDRMYPLPDGLNLTPVMTTRALHEQMRMVEVPIPYRERIGRSKLSIVRDGTRFAQSIVWTALNYNPVRLLGLIGLIEIALAALIVAGLVLARLMGVTSIGPTGAFAVYSAMVLGVTGVSIFALGASFNYFVSLFHKRPVRQGLFGRPLLPVRLEHYFGIAGTVLLVLGLGLAGVSLVLGLNGWPLSRLWLYYLASASLTLVGMQLVVFWIEMQVLEALNSRKALAADDMRLPVLASEPARAAGPSPELVALGTNTN